MERNIIHHPEIHEIIEFDSKINTAKAFATEVIINEIKKYPSLPITFATGDTMLPIYEELRTAVNENKINCENILVHHLDEYYPISPIAKYSFVNFLYENVFNPLHIKEKNIFILNGLAKNPHEEADKYDKILQNHKIGLVILGVGPGGHIAFNETGTDFNSRTHLQILSPESIYRDQVERGQDTPNTAITQGIATILEADRIVLIAYGKYKGKILKKALFENLCIDCPASALRLSGNKVSIYVDNEAAKEIKLETTI